MDKSQWDKAIVIDISFVTHFEHWYYVGYASGTCPEVKDWINMTCVMVYHIYGVSGPN